MCLLNAQPNLADAVPVLGHIPKFFRQLAAQPKSALRVLHQLSLSEVSGEFDLFCRGFLMAVVNMIGREKY